MELYLIVLLPISSIFLLCMLVLLVLFERIKKQTLHMINGGYYFIQKDDSYIGIPPEYIEEAGLAIRPDRV
ncbi:hypothetical protein TcasGA2_TC034556 [Tribolium castaneum]|uniref:Uncharacterized protein n=1 Tax=Tribolium castaneum TaxID=7070 RepID=A0A139WMV8_TRICA|nr:hypothetical protein TcasGA2_TC034556 [Tribolium castaneum]